MTQVENLVDSLVSRTYDESKFDRRAMIEIFNGGCSIEESVCKKLEADVKARGATLEDVSGDKVPDYVAIPRGPYNLFLISNTCSKYFALVADGTPYVQFIDIQK